MQVDGDRLVLTPESAIQRRSDPDDPDGDYDRELPLQARSLRWELSGRPLTLTGSDGQELQLERVQD